MKLLRLFRVILLVSAVSAAPSPSSVTSAPASTPTVPYASDDPNYPLWNEYSSITPEAIRGTFGADVIGPQNIALDLQNPDALAPPTTDNGAIPNFKWPFSLSNNKLATGGWARQQNINQMPVATDLAGVNMRLEAGAIREMHWHNTAEWAYILKGYLRISTITPDGQVYVGDVGPGDIWYFPSGNPHSIQAKDTTPDGAEFLLIFDSGKFSEDSTFLLTDWLAHVPKEVYREKFPASPPPENVNDDMVIPNNTPIPYTFALSQVPPTTVSGGSYKVVDSRTFVAAQTIAAVEVEVVVGGMRELHWHPTEPEWTYYVSSSVRGNARVTAYAANSNAVTSDFKAGDIGYIPPSFGHYVENTGNTTLIFLEIFKSNLFQDISLNQWLALTPPELVKAHLNLDDATIQKLF